ncbi:hypothetical protein HPB50_019049 [Hyalomma asiaticum]|uniref:Uncharacterized protein n=1 Tax=Hyalomma asiaticum TaxID=266040 RepID=A0ACB7TMK7_HYAAI|nr:hypothetical protein HPB50_019049 [Hyalomma asiaticum]
MHPVYNQGRRRARAKDFLSQLNSRRENALFVDASRSGPNIFVAAVEDMSGRTVSVASVRTRSIGVAEQVVISLALTTKDPSRIFSDSMTTVSPNLANQLRAVQGACEAIGNLWFPALPRAMPSAGS